MKIHTTLRLTIGAALVAASMLGAAPARTQERRIQRGAEQERRPLPVEVAPPAHGVCPRPVNVTLDATTPYVLNSDFAPAHLSGPRATLNETAPDKGFLHTFQWRKEQRCCEVTKAVLTVKMRALQSGYSQTSSDAGNDAIHLLHGGSAVLPFSERVYGSWPFSAGQTAVKGWNLTGAALGYLNTNGTVSFYVQDDTAVESATLQIQACCLSSSPRGGAFEDARPER